MQLFANNAASVLANGISSAATTAQLAPGTGARFPNPANGNYFLLTLYQMSGSMEVNHEIVKCSARNGDTITILRAQEGTTARAFNTADPVSLRLTAGSLTPAAIGAYPLEGNPSNFLSSVPNASSGTLGLVRVGANLAIDPNGVLSANAASAIELLASATIGAPVANVDFPNIFSAQYSRYEIELSGVKMDQLDVLGLRLCTSGAVDATQKYMSGGTVSASDTYVSLSSWSPIIAIVNALITLINTNDASGMKYINTRSQFIGDFSRFSSTNKDTAYLGGVVSGIRLFAINGNNLTAGKIRIYGYKN
jgi:hypothetical protein